jgi:hypothetical protein
MGGLPPRKRATAVNRLKKHLSVANAISCMALFVALSGVAYAANTLKKNQVKAQNIAKEAVTAPKLKNASVISSKLANDSVISVKLANGSVVSAKIANGAITAGKLANGAVTSKKIGKDAITANAVGSEAITTGKLGNEAVTSGKISSSAWSQLLKNVTYVTETSINDSETAKSTTATCPTNKQAIGGGVRINGGNTDGIVVPSESAPVVSATNSRVGWIASGRETVGETASWQVIAYAICAEL